MRKHTQGPWSIGHVSQQSTDPRIGPFFSVPIHVGQADNKGNVLATVCMGGAGATDGKVEAVMANAKLIAVSPDLYEALNLLYTSTADYITRNNLGDPHHNHSMKLARAALAKAKGVN